MTNAKRIVLIAAVATALSGCGTTESYDSGSGSSGLRQASSAAETACMTAVNSQYSGGNVRSVEVISSEFSEANSVVMVEAVGVRGGSMNERYRCLVSNDGKVEELSGVE